MASIEEVFYSKANNNKVGTLESILSGVASGIIAIPKGFFSLGATLMDLGVDSGRAARVEQFLMILQSLMRKQKQQLLVELQKH